MKAKAQHSASWSRTRLRTTGSGRACRLATMRARGENSCSHSAVVSNSGQFNPYSRALALWRHGLLPAFVTMPYHMPDKDNRCCCDAKPHDGYRFPKDHYSNKQTNAHFGAADRSRVKARKRGCDEIERKHQAKAHSRQPCPLDLARIAFDQHAAAGVTGDGHGFFDQQQFRVPCKYERDCEHDDTDTYSCNAGSHRFGLRDRGCGKGCDSDRQNRKQTCSP